MVDVSGWLTLTYALIIGVLTLVTVLIWRSNKALRLWKQVGIPGPKPLPLVGNMLGVMKLGFLSCFTFWRKEYGDVYGLYFSSNPVLVITDFDLLKEVMIKRFSTFSNRQQQTINNYKPWKNTLLALQDDEWKNARSTLSPTFSSGKLKKMMQTMERVLKNLNTRLQQHAKSGDSVELKDLSGAFAMDAIAGAAFGIELNSLHNLNEPFVKHAFQLIRPRKIVLPFLLLFGWTLPYLRKVGIDFLPKESVNFFLDISEAAINERRQDSKKYGDFLQLLVEAEKEKDSQGIVDAEIDHRDHLHTSKQWTRKGLTTDEMHANALIFLLAGYDTVSTVMSFTLFMLAANPECLRKAQHEVDIKLGKNTAVTYEIANELSYLDMCINESMRLYPPGFVLEREASEDIELRDYKIPKRTRIFVPVYTIHTDPDIWPDPMKFDPERHTLEAQSTRNPFSFLPFGMGPRNCIGMRLAQMEIRMAVASILQHFTPVLCEKSVNPPRLYKLNRMGAEDGLWVKFESRE